MERVERCLTRDECVIIIALAAEGHSHRDLGQRFGVAHTTIGRMLQRYDETNDHARRPGQGRRRATTAIEDRFVRLKVLRDHHDTPRDHRNQLQNVHGTRVSTDTIRRRLAEHDTIPDGLLRDRLSQGNTAQRGWVLHNNAWNGGKGIGQMSSSLMSSVSLFTAPKDVPESTGGEIRVTLLALCSRCYLSVVGQ